MDGMYYVVLSVAQAATEFLPVSSSGHLLFLKGLLGTLHIPIIFDVVVHVGSLVAILVFYCPRIFETLKNAGREIGEKREQKDNVKLLSYLAVSTVVTFLFYLIFKRWLETGYQSPSVLVITYSITTVVLFSTYLTEHRQTKAVWERGIVLPVLVGLLQGIAILPGISRSGFTIAPLLLLGIKREEAAYYSFFLAIPAILGALVLKLFEVGGIQFLVDHWAIVTLSFVTSMLFSYCFLVLLVAVLKRGRFWVFSGYTLSVAVVSGVIFW